MYEAWLQLGKIGDIISILPILNAEFERTGKPPQLVVSRLCSSILDQIDYVEPVIYEGHWQDFDGGLKFAKRNFDRVLCTQVHGAGIRFQNRHPSFQLDSWDRVGMLNQWDRLPLILPRIVDYNSPERFILYADHSQSSPFLHKDDLAKLLAENFPNHRIVRLSEVKEPNILNILPMMDAADLVVTVETAHLHMSAATKTPVIAMVASKPSPWRGSAWSKRFRLHCRYDDYEFRKDEIIRAAKDAIDDVRPIEPVTIPTKHPNGFNMGIVTSNGVRTNVYRYYHTKGNWMTHLAIDGKDIQFPSGFENHGMEDARGFVMNGKAHLAYVCTAVINRQFYSVMAYGPIERNGDGWTVTKQIIPKYGKNDFSSKEKNWVPFVYDGALHFIYGIKGGNQIVIRQNGEQWSEIISPAPTWKYGEIRGGCIAPHGDHWVRFFHCHHGEMFKRRYYMGACLMESKPPFRTLKVSSRPIYAGNEKYTPDCWICIRNCILPYGCYKNGDRFRVTAGRNDCESVEFDLSYGDLNL